VDDVRARYLRDRVLTASPAQRVVMLYDRMLLDLRLAATADDPYVAGTNVSHAVQILAELQGSMDHRHGGPAENLSAIYGYLIGGLLQARISGDLTGLDGYITMIADLRLAWAEAALADSTTSATGTATATAWVG
jgi:flagellar secretion chaperone FliS